MYAEPQSLSSLANSSNMAASSTNVTPLLLSEPTPKLAVEHISPSHHDINGASVTTPPDDRSSEWHLGTLASATVSQRHSNPHFRASRFITVSRKGRSS